MVAYSVVHPDAPGVQADGAYRIVTFVHGEGALTDRAKLLSLTSRPFLSTATPLLLPCDAVPLKVLMDNSEKIQWSL